MGMQNVACCTCCLVNLRMSPAVYRWISSPAVFSSPVERSFSRLMNTRALRMVNKWLINWPSASIILAAQYKMSRNGIYSDQILDLILSAILCLNCLSAAVLKAYSVLVYAGSFKMNCICNGTNSRDRRS